jgi:predicted transcriptional regulator
MTSNIEIKNKQLFNKIKIVSNKIRFKIIELTQDNEINITDLSSALRLAYNKTSDYVAILEKQGLIIKNSDGKNVKVKSKIKLSNNQIIFN